jgi:hypothetical protein
MTDQQRETLRSPFRVRKRLAGERTLLLAGSTLGSVSTGIAVFQAPAQAAGEEIMASDPVISGGYARGELSAFKVSLLRGRD